MFYIHQFSMLVQPSAVRDIKIFHRCIGFGLLRLCALPLIKVGAIAKTFNVQCCRGLPLLTRHKIYSLASTQPCFTFPKKGEGTTTSIAKNYLVGRNNGSHLLGPHKCHVRTVMTHIRLNYADTVGPWSLKHIHICVRKKKRKKNDSKI